MAPRGRKRVVAVAAEDRPPSTKSKSKPKKAKRAAAEPMDDKEEMNLWNERIRYATALEFLSQQEQLLFPQDSEDSTDAPPLPRRLTRGMCHSLLQFQKSSLTCPLCHTVYAQPVTLSGCAHTFCKSCINDHVDDSWYCPIPSCKLPVSMKQEQRKFWNINAAMQSVVTSWSNICHTLMEAEQDWWILRPSIPKEAAKDRADSSVAPRNKNDEQTKLGRPESVVLPPLRQPMEDDDDDSSVDEGFATADEDDPVMADPGPTTSNAPPQDDDSVSLF